jgi:hypothetical protein
MERSSDRRSSGRASHDRGALSVSLMQVTLAAPTRQLRFLRALSSSPPWTM